MPAAASPLVVGVACAASERCRLLHLLGQKESVMDDITPSPLPPPLRTRQQQLLTSKRPGTSPLARSAFMCSRKPVLRALLSSKMKQIGSPLTPARRMTARRSSYQKSGDTESELNIEHDKGFIRHTDAGSKATPTHYLPPPRCAQPCMHEGTSNSGSP